MILIKLNLWGPLLTWTLSKAVEGTLATCSYDPVFWKLRNVFILHSVEKTSVLLLFLLRSGSFVACAFMGMGLGLGVELGVCCFICNL